MSIWGRTAVVGVHEHPTRFAPDKTAYQLHAESARGALEDAGLGVKDVDGLFTSGASYAVTWSDPDSAWAETIVIVDGSYVPGQEQGTPLHGDLDVDPTKVVALTDLFRDHLREILERKTE